MFTRTSEYPWALQLRDIPEAFRPADPRLLLEHIENHCPHANALPKAAECVPVQYYLFNTNTIPVSLFDGKSRPFDLIILHDVIG